MIDTETTPKRPGGSTAPHILLWVALMKAFAAVRRRSESDLAGRGLTSGEFGVLTALYHGGPMFLVELQKRQLVSSGGITYLVDRLAGRGLVERRTCPSDRRARYVALTRVGERLMKEVVPAHSAVLREWLGGLSVAEQRRASSLLRRIRRHAADPEVDAGME